LLCEDFRVSKVIGTRQQQSRIFRGERLTAVPAGVDDANAQGAAVVLLRLSGALERCHDLRGVL
jgi:hypothetical protein